MAVINSEIKLRYICFEIYILYILLRTFIYLFILFVMFASVLSNLFVFIFVTLKSISSSSPLWHYFQFYANIRRLVNLTTTRSAVVPRTIVAFSLFYSASIAAGRSSFVTARYYGNASPLCHSVVSSTRSCGREESESKERRDNGYRVAAVVAAAAATATALVFPSCVTVVHSSSIALQVI